MGLRTLTSTKTDYQLDQSFDAEEVFEEGGELVEAAASDDRELVVFLVPGIRSNKTWAQNFRIYSNSFTSRKIIPYVVGSSYDMSSFDVIFRYRNQKLRADIERQIVDISKSHKNSDINFICHSMGSSIFADIVENLNNKINGRGGNEIKFIFYIGSICRKKDSGNIWGICENFVNDAGQRDFVVLMAGVANPLKYDPVGFFGFNNAHTQDRFFPEVNHGSCTSEEHISEWMVPVLDDGIIRQPSRKVEVRGYNLFRYARRALWLMVPILAVFAMY